MSFIGQKRTFRSYNKPYRSPSYTGYRKYGTYDMGPPKKKPRDYANSRTGGYNALEKKYFDLQTNCTPISNTPGSENVVLLNAITTGNGPTQRQGRSYTITKVMLNMKIYTRQPVDRDVSVRLVVVADKQANGSTLDPNLIFNHGNVSNDFFGRYTTAFRSLERSSRFKIISDDLVTIPAGEAYFTANGTDGKVDLVEPAIITGENSVNMHEVRKSVFSKNLKLPVNTTGLDGGIGSISDNAVWLAVFVDDNAYNGILTNDRGIQDASAAIAQVRVDFTSRIRFYE